MKTKLTRALALLGLAILAGVFLHEQKDNTSNLVENFTEDALKNAKAQYYSATTPQLILAGPDVYTNRAGLISLSSEAQPAIEVSSYNVNGKAKFTLYRASENQLLDFLLHDKESNQLNKNVPTASMDRLGDFELDLANNQGSKKLSLPLTPSGIWYIESTLDTAKASAFIIRSSYGTVVKQTQDSYLFWTQNFAGKRAAQNGQVRVYSLENQLRLLDSVSINSEGVALSPFTEEADVAVADINGDLAVVPINLNELNYNYSWNNFVAKTANKYFYIFTDRPVYKPGDTVYFKAILRQEVAGEMQPHLETLEAKVFREWNEQDVIFRRNFSPSANGAFDGEYKIPVDAQTGNYQLKISAPSQPADWWSSDASYVSFAIEFFRKPEYSIEIGLPESQYVNGDEAEFEINGSYFFGQPLTGQKVTYTVRSNSMYNYEHFSDFSYILENDYAFGYWYGTSVNEGEVTLNKEGKAKVKVNTQAGYEQDRLRVFSVEARMTDETQNPSIARKNFLVFPSKLNLFKDGGEYWVREGQQLKLAVKALGLAGQSVSDVELSAQGIRENWVHESVAGQQWPNYRREESKLPEVKVKTNKEGKAEFNFNAAQKGHYTITVTGKDDRGFEVKKDFYLWVSGENEPVYWRQPTDNSLSIKLNRDEYQVGDTASLRLTSTLPERDVLLTVERSVVEEYQVVKINGASANVPLIVREAYLPNVYVNLSAFSQEVFHDTSENLIVDTSQKRLTVNLKPDKAKYGPGDTINVAIETKDGLGRAVPSEVAFWAVDKAIFELKEDQRADIFKTFWSERYLSTIENHSLKGIYSYGGAEQGGCFAEGTEVRTKNGTQTIENIKIGDAVLAKDPKTGKTAYKKVLDVHKAIVPGLLIINSELKLTPEHIIYLDGKWQEAAYAQVGMELELIDGQRVKINSIEWQLGRFPVYNLTVEDYHTYFAEGYLVHNDKGGGGGVGRITFKDTAYWNPKVKTDAQGKATVRFKLPDNLTTWMLASVAVGNDNEFGEELAEAIVTKDVIVRPILPNILRENDEASFSALVQNFSGQDRDFNVIISYDSGEIEATVLENSSENRLQIKNGEFAQLFWKLIPKGVKEKANITVEAVALDPQNGKADYNLSDKVVASLPQRSTGFMEKTSEAATDEHTFDLKLFSDTKTDLSKVTISIAPTLLGTLPEAMEYLIQYPYGCVEQTTSRFVPAVIAKENSNLFRESLKDKDLDAIINTGVKHLEELQGQDGGWGWWFTESDPFISAYVTEYLLKAQDLGFKVSTEVLQKAKLYAENTANPENNPSSPAPMTPYNQNEVRPNLAEENLISGVYSQALIGSVKIPKAAKTTSVLTADIIAMAAIANRQNGFFKEHEAALEMLRKSAQTQGDSVYWTEGRGIYFGSKEASTAMSVRALLTSQKASDLELAEKGVKYLTRIRQRNYWANTYATAQVIRAVVDYAKVAKDANPNYTYQILLDGKEITKGNFTEPSRFIKISIPTKDIKTEGSKIEIKKQGSGQIYSTLVMEQMRTELEAAKAEKGMKLERTYANKNGSESFGVGDTVLVTLKISGLTEEKEYAVIEDQLPAGLIPVNKSFLNEGNGSYYGYYYNSSNWELGVASKQYTENGAIISLYRVLANEHIVTYEARAVQAGKFTAPPAVASLMYEPEVFARSAVQAVEISQDPVPIRLSLLSSLGANNRKGWWFIGVSSLAILLAAGGIYYHQRKNSKKPLPNNDQFNQPPKV
jgi:alpha-2-macroglobulin